MAQERRVLLANGQYITIVQTTGTSSGDVMSQSAVTAALSTKSDVGHTHNASAITGGTFGTNMIADGAITTAKIHDKSVTLDKLADNVPISTASYEIVKVSGLTTDGTAAIGAKVTIGGASYKFDSTGVVSAPIPYGQIYKVQTYFNSAWAGNYEATFTASTALRTISITYSENNGVFIEAKDGMLYTSSNWDSSETANSIVILTDGIKFRVALTEPSTRKISSASTDPLENYMTAISGETEAKADYKGAENTASILKMQPSTDYAAGYCNAFTFPDGSTKGFLPSLGQLNLAYQNKAAVDTALSKCGGTAMNTSQSYWTSTFWGAQSNGNRNCWQLNWGNGSLYNFALDNYGRIVRPFAAY